jgi:hypothetical protein
MQEAHRGSFNYNVDVGENRRRSLLSGLSTKESEGTIPLDRGFVLERKALWPHHEARGRARRMGGGSWGPVHRSATWTARRFLTDVSLHHHFGGRTSTEATYPMLQTHWFREQPAIARTMIGFVVIATGLYLILGPIGILYALGFEVLYLLVYVLSVAFAALLDPDEY